MSTTEKTRRLIEERPTDLIEWKNRVISHFCATGMAYVRVAEVLAERGCTHPGYCDADKWLCDTCQALAALDTLEADDAE